ncbi:MAG: glycoside hydrolase family 27 protein [Bacteroidetes bacterium]|nr:glycoside hydrolase family 27 protein [Bacteroidota bacterium]
MEYGLRFRHSFFKIVLFLIFFPAQNFIQAQTSAEIAPTPPMGWNTWHCLRTEFNEADIKGMADAMVSSGMKDAGYQYIVIDDGWVTSARDKNGHIIVDSIKFPNGIKPVADYVHSLGLKFGLYSAPGCLTCQKLMGSFGYEQTDANDYAAWGVDYLKYDHCNYPKTTEEMKNTSEADCRAAFELMRDCLKKTGRPILYSVHDVCTRINGENTRENALPWVRSVANMHRTSDDIKDNWDRMLFCLETTVDLWEYAGPGYWNDPDMLEVGNLTRERLWGGISPVKMVLHEYQSQFSMWCIVAAPLIAGNDLRTMSTEITKILTNKEVIAINQDKLGKQGRRIRDDGEIEVWAKELEGKKYAVALFNRSSSATDITVDWKELGLKGKHMVRDLWLHEDIGKFNNTFTGKNIPGHVAMVILIN